MASLEEALQKTFLFTAARDGGKRNFYEKGSLGPGAPISCSQPVHDPAVPRSDRRVWSWKHDPATPAKVTDVTATMLNEKGTAMVMPVCKSVEVQSVSVVVRPGEASVALPLTQEYVLLKYKLESGHIQGIAGWWRLPAEVDQSLLVVFGYEIREGKPQPLNAGKITEMGKRFLTTPDVAPDDPDAGRATWSKQDWNETAIRATAGGAPGVVYVSNTFIIVAWGFATCKEAPDFFPGEILGTGRIYPHVMVTSNLDLHKVATTISIVRPEKAKKCDPQMRDDIGSILFTDANEVHALFSKAVTSYTDFTKLDRISPVATWVRDHVPPFPLWSNFFDYYDLAPSTGSEYKVVDPSLGRRTVSGGIQREARLGGYESSSPFVKVARQGGFDSIHVAPRMYFTLKDGVVLDNIAMAPFCVHDCLHMHFRWGAPMVKPDDPDQVRIVAGFDGRKPNSVWTAPLVPDDQAVWIQLTGPSSFTYRAETTRLAKRGTWTVFCHHGMGYPLSINSATKVLFARGAVAGVVMARGEEYTRVTETGESTVIDDVDPLANWAAFYWRLRWMHTGMERIRILDLAKCRDK